MARLSVGGFLPGSHRVNAKPDLVDVDSAKVKQLQVSLTCSLITAHGKGLRTKKADQGNPISNHDAVTSRQRFSFRCRTARARVE